MFEFGTNEVVVGRGASGQFAGPHRRQRDRSRARTRGRWSASSRPTAASPKPRSGATRACCRAPIAAATPIRRCWRGSTRPTASTRSATGCTSNPQVNVQVRRETEYYAQQSRALSGLIQGVGFGIAALMGIGAVFGAILTMYTAVSTRVARDRHAARARLQRHVGRGVGAGRIAGARGASAA